MHPTFRNMSKESRFPSRGEVNEALLRPFRKSPRDAGIFLDFDGTISDIVLIPTDARPAEGARNALADLASRLGLVVIVSGRSASQLVEWLGPEVEIWGTHGAERARDGRIEINEKVRPYLELMEDVKARAEAAVESLGLTGIIVEDKGSMLTFHFRAAEERARAESQLDDLASRLAKEHGLRRAGGRLAFELRPPVDLSKADVVLRRGREESLSSCMFIGDDVVDLPGFDALDELEREGLHVVRVAVNSNEAPEELIERADVVLENPLAVVGFLQDLATTK